MLAGRQTTKNLQPASNLAKEKECHEERDTECHEERDTVPRGLVAACHKGGKAWMHV